MARRESSGLWDICDFCGGFQKGRRRRRRRSQSENGILKEEVGKRQVGILKYHHIRFRFRSKKKMEIQNEISASEEV